MFLLTTQLTAVGHLAFSPDNYLLAAAGRWKGEIELWHLPSRELRRRLCLPPDYHYFSGLFFSPDGSRLLVGKWNASGMFDPATGARRRWLPAGWGGLRGVSPDGRFLVLSAGRGDALRVRLVRAEPGARPVAVWDRPQPNQAWLLAAVTPDGRTVGYRAGNSLVLWDGAGKLQLEVPSPGALRALAVTPDGRRLLGLGRRSILVWEGIDLTRRPRKVTSDTRQEVNALAVHPTGQHALLASNDGSVKLGDLVGRAVVRSYHWEVGPLSPVALSPDGTLAATAGGGSVVVWDLEL